MTKMGLNWHELWEGGVYVAFTLLMIYYFPLTGLGGRADAISRWVFLGVATIGFWVTA